MRRREFDGQCEPADGDGGRAIGGDCLAGLGVAVRVAVRVAIGLGAGFAFGVGLAVPAPVRLMTLKPGAHGKAVKAMQQRLKDLGYWLPSVDSAYGGYTRSAVTALQKAAGLPRNGVLGRKTLKALQKGVVPTPRSTKPDVLEVDKRKQLLMIVHDGRLRWILDISTGSGRTYVDPKTHITGVARTPDGSFTIQRQIDGWRTSTLGHLWRPKYFNGGIAFHGFPYVPPFPASHGCVRLTMAAINMLWSSGLAPVGTPVLVRG